MTVMAGERGSQNGAWVAGAQLSCDAVGILGALGTRPTAQSGNYVMNCAMVARKYRWSRGITVGVVTRLQTGRPRVMVRSLARARHFSFF